MNFASRIFTKIMIFGLRFGSQKNKKVYKKIAISSGYKKLSEGKYYVIPNN